MQITFRRTGGFAPMPIGCQFDTTTMPAEEARYLETLVLQSGIMTAESASIKGACDVYSYTVEVTNDEQYHQVTFDQLSIPAGVKQLIDFLSKQSRSLLPDD